MDKLIGTWESVCAGTIAEGNSDDIQADETKRALVIDRSLNIHKCSADSSLVLYLSLSCQWLNECDED